MLLIVAHLKNDWNYELLSYRKYDDTASQIIAIVGRQGGWEVLWNNSTGSQSELVYVFD